MNFKLSLTLLVLFFNSLNSLAQKQKDEPLAFEDDLLITWVDKPDTAYLVAINKIHAPLEVLLTTKDKGEQSYLVRALDSTVLMTQPKVIIGKKSGSIKFEYQIGYHLGHPDLIEIDKGYLYRFPFGSDKSYLIGQSWGGRATHHTTESFHAIDFQLEKGEQIHAARNGVVVKVIDWFTKQGGPKLAAAANEIVILHEDGTLASYVHLEYQGAMVKAGEYVEKGQHIGYSGATGYATGPHLHFVVKRDRDQSIPIYFEGHKNQELEEGKVYGFR